MATNKEVKESIKETAVYNINYAAISGAIHAINKTGGSEQEEIGKEREKEIEKRVHERLAQLPKENRAATIKDLLSFGNETPEEEELMCKECEQHFDGDGDMMTCDACDGCWHVECSESPTDEDSDEMVRFYLVELMAECLDVFLRLNVNNFFVSGARSYPFAPLIHFHVLLFARLLCFIRKSGTALVARVHVLPQMVKIATAGTRMEERVTVETRLVELLVPGAREQLGRGPVGRGTPGSFKRVTQLVRRRWLRITRRQRRVRKRTRKTSRLWTKGTLR